VYTVEDLLGRSSCTGLESRPSIFKIVTNFAYKRRSLGRFSSLEDLSHGVIIIISEGILIFKGFAFQPNNREPW
jgi:hypothetical protein